MTRENVDIVRDMVEAFLRRDSEHLESLLAPDIEWDTTLIAGVVPDLAGVYRGQEGTRALWSTWLSAWKDLVFDFSLADGGNDIVVLIQNQHQRGRHSDVDTRIPDYAWVYTVEDGRVTRGCFYPDHRSALEATGLS